ncbi:unnamed protein product [Moneuplotes crassus]|uniref:Uncharacterized protein n=1 Tax=Euplotes crassus TaxID=5936 RepID=A0AAD1UI31_EUPCR|nr:unnamed protein product [Moneuplotes crassus]
MEQTPKCNVDGCNLTAKYLHNLMRIRVCQEHYQPDHKESWTRIVPCKEVEQALGLFTTCMKNFTIANDSNEGEGLNEDIQSFNAKVARTTDEFTKLEQEEDPKKLEEMEQELINLITELRKNESFKQFCVKHYMHLICEYLNIQIDEIERFIDTKIDTISLEQKLKQSEDGLKNLNKELNECRKKFVNTVGTTTIPDFELCYELITSSKATISPASKLILDCYKPQDINFMQCMGDNILPNFNHLSIRRIDENLNLVNNFVLSSFPQNVKGFSLNTNGKLIDCEPVMNLIIHTSSSVLQSMYLSNFIISQSQLKTLLQTTCKNQSELHFLHCQMMLDSVPNLNYCLRGSKIKALNFSNCGPSGYCDFENHPERFENLINALSQSSDFKKNFSAICLSRCGMAKLYVEDTLKKFEFQEVTIEKHSV